MSNKVWVVIFMGSADVDGSLMELGEVLGVFSSVEAANAFCDAFEDNYTRRKTDLDITEMTIAEG